MGLLWDDIEFRILFLDGGSASLVPSIIFSILLFYGRGRQYLPYGNVEINTSPNYIVSIFWVPDLIVVG